MKRLTLAIAGLLAFGLVHSARAGVFDGYLAECSAVTATTCTEPTATGYTRQPISFNGIGGGTVVSASPYTFPPVATATISLAGRAIFDAPAGGNLLAVVPLASAATTPSYGDRAEAGAIRFTIPGYAGAINADTISALWPAGTTIGTTPDGSAVTAGVNVQMARGKAQAYAGGSDPIYSVANTQTTGFTATIPNGISTYGVTGAGTLATGTINLQAVPTEGELQRLLCDVTVTTLTVTPQSGYSFIGTPPTSCGANAAHEFQYFVAAKKVRILF
jgi:hypothetical protein